MVTLQDLLAGSNLPAFDASLSLSRNLVSDHVDTADVDQDEWPPRASTSKATLLSAGPSQSTSGAALSWLQSALPEDLCELVLASLASSLSSDELASQLLDIIGFDRVDLVPQLLERRTTIQAELEEREDHEHAASVLSSHHAAPQEASIEDPTELARQQHSNYVPQAQVTFSGGSGQADIKKARKAAARQAKAQQLEQSQPKTLRQLARIRQAQLDSASARPLASKGASDHQEAVYPHVYAAHTGGSTLSQFGQKFSLPAGTTKASYEKYEEVTIPTPDKIPMRSSERLIPIHELDDFAKGCFPGYATLNRLQSVVYPASYHTNENLLICAPTGAGKTDVAVMTVLRAISQNADLLYKSDGSAHLSNYNFKIVYVAPMKALAAEVVRKFSKRFRWLGVNVRELTGDMQLTRAELAKTQVIVTTPEKWTVVTNKPSAESDLANQVKLLIIDEVHLLHDERGAVIETIVARTLRQVESSQSLIRIVGLSATLPNYVDVAQFLGVNLYQGMFYFDQSFRPVPLEQHFLGVKGKPNSSQSRENLDIACFDKIADLVKEGHQVMVFVHSRKETVKTAEMLVQRAQEEQILDLFSPQEHPRYEITKKELASSRNRELKDLYNKGFGIHHAGMLRSDRTMSERIFENNLTQVLVCTATLAWGVNLPAYAVIIKGTTIYDAGKGSFVDLSILDVLQIFGRAGRPQYETHGVGHIITTSDKVSTYVSAITQQHPIESKFVQGLLDSLNSEIALGTVSSIDEGVRWIGYTFLYVRLRKNPLAYGLTADEVLDDPALANRRQQLMISAVRQLRNNEMITWDEDTGSVSPTEVGFLAAKYYLKSASIEKFNSIFKANMSEADFLWVLSESTEFAQITVRDTEIPELDSLQEKVPCQIKGGIQTTAGKVNVLLQAYISRLYIDDFALVSDSGYVVQNAGRIARALFEMAMSKKWSSTARIVLAMCISIERRMWPFDHPLGQCNLSAEILYNVSQFIDDMSLNEISDSSAAQLGKLIKMNERNGQMVKTAARLLPRFQLQCKVRPLSTNILLAEVRAERRFNWDSKAHGGAQAFWLWVADAEDNLILRTSRILFRSTMERYDHTFVIAMSSMPDQLVIRLMSDGWLDSEDVVEALTGSLALPSTPAPKLQVLDVPLLSTREALGNSVALDFKQVPPTMDPIQTQVFHSLAFTSNNTVISAPETKSRLMFMILAIWRSLSDPAKGDVLVLVQDVHSIQRVTIALQRALGQAAPILVASKPEDFLEAPLRGTVVSSPETVYRALRGKSSLPPADTVISYDFHLLDAQLELVLAHFRQGDQCRIVLLSFPLHDPRSAAKWTDCPEEHTYGFGPSARSAPLQTEIHAVSTARAGAFLQTALKPAHEILKTEGQPAICIVPSASSCRAAASTFVRQLASDLNPDSFVGSAAMLEDAAALLGEDGYGDMMLHGISVCHEGMPIQTRRLMLKLFNTGATRLMVTTPSFCFSSAMSAPVLLVVGVQTPLMSQDGTRVMADYEPAKMFQLLNVPSGASAKCVILCEPHQEDSSLGYLKDGLLLESELLEAPPLLLQLLQSLQEDSSYQSHHLMPFFGSTFIQQRIASNPGYYGFHRGSTFAANLSRAADSLFQTLRSICCIAFADDRWNVTQLGSHVLKKPERMRGLLTLRNQPFATMLLRLKGAKTEHQPDEQLQKFVRSLPRSLKTALQAAELTSHAAAMLLAGFFAGRTPPSAELERQQIDTVLTILKQVF